MIVILINLTEMESDQIKFFLDRLMQSLLELLNACEPTSKFSR